MDVYKIDRIIYELELFRDRNVKYKDSGNISEDELKYLLGECHKN